MVAAHGRGLRRVHHSSASAHSGAVTSKRPALPAKPTFTSKVLQGPWDEAFTVLVPFTMRSKSNFRRGFDRDKWNQLKDFESGLSILMRSALPEGWVIGSKDASLSSRPVVINAIYAVSTLDTANLSKSVLDACEGLVFHTDASVRALTAVSDRSSSASWGLVSFARLPASATLEEAANAASVLMRSTLDQILL